MIYTAEKIQKIRNEAEEGASPSAHHLINRLCDSHEELRVKLDVAIETLKRIENLNSAKEECGMRVTSYRDWELRQFARVALTEMGYLRGLSK